MKDSSSTVVRPDIVALLRFDGSGTRYDLIGERELVIEIMRDAVRILESPRNKQRDHRGRTEVLQWVMTPGDSVFSFEWCCMYLDLEPSALRRRMLNVKPNPNYKSQGYPARRNANIKFQKERA